MELEFRQTQIPFFQCVCHETVVQEERGETIVPDSMPDMERIVGCWAEAVLRDRECRDGVLCLTGDVQACVLYRAAGEDAPRKLGVLIPFSLRRTVPDGRCSFAVRLAVKRADAQMPGSRRAGVRVTLLITLRVWQTKEQVCFCPEGTDRRVQMKFAEYPMRLVRECAQKQVLLRDVLPLGAGVPDVSQILHAGARCEMTEEKLSGSQAVCKGVLRLDLLCQTPEGALAGCTLSMPFSQLIDLEGSYEEQGLELVPALTSLETMAEGGGVSVEAGLCLQCVVTQTVNVPLVEDAYALRGALRTETGRLELQPLLDSRSLRQDCALELPAQAGEILRAEAMADAPAVEWDGGLCRIRVPVAVRVLYRDGRGEYRQAEGGTELRQELSAEPSACRAEAEIEGPVYAVAGADRIELRVPVAVQARWYDENERRFVCAAQLDEGPREERPAVIIRTLEADAPLWDIAKELRTTVSAIQIANDMDADVAPAGTMLLIPIVA